MDVKKTLGYLFTEGRKAVIAFAGGAVSAALPLILADVQAASDGGSTITHDEWTGVAAAAIVAGLTVGLAVFGIANKPTPTPVPPVPPSVP